MKAISHSDILKSALNSSLTTDDENVSELTPAAKLELRQQVVLSVMVTYFDYEMRKQNITDPESEQAHIVLDNCLDIISSQIESGIATPATIRKFKDTVSKQSPQQVGLEVDMPQGLDHAWISDALLDFTRRSILDDFSDEEQEAIGDLQSKLEACEEAATKVGTLLIPHVYESINTILTSTDAFDREFVEQHLQ